MQKRCEGHLWAIIIALALVLISSASCTPKEQSSEGKAAIVNGSVITQEEFDKQIDRFKQQFAASGKTVSESELLDAKKKILEDLINRELLYQESKKMEIRVDEALITKQKDQIKKRFPKEEDYKSWLSKMNFSEEEILSQIRIGMVLEQLTQKKFADKIQISDEESKTYYNSNPASFKKPEQVNARHILIKVDPKADKSVKAEARKKIGDIRKKLEQGEAFATLAKEHSQCPSSEKGGDLGYFPRGKMVKPFDEAVFALKPGELSDVVETRFGYHLIKAIDKKTESTTSYEDVKERLKGYLKQQKVQTQMRSYTKQLREKAEVEIFLPEKQEDKS
ncbi:MAG: peptidylprolyl isomerase [Desulfobacterales bacterium]|nr:peptidylprolyl isomerase [Desulfobacterales bacterium]